MLRSTRFWLLILGVLLTLGLAAMLLLSLTQTAGDRVRITQNGVLQYDLPLFVDDTITLQSGNGYNTVRIEGGAVAILAANCPDGRCTRHAPIHTSGHSIVCLPHKLLVEVISERASHAVDVVSS